jgi:hypothetical protein
MQKEAAIRTPLILGDKTYHDITEDICRPIESKAPKAWYVLLAIAGVVALWGVGCILYLLGTGIGEWGLEQNSRLGMGYHQLRMVGRYRSRRYADLCHPSPVPSEVENFH